MLKLRLKAPCVEKEESNIKWRDFLHRYFNNMFSELNAILSDYRAIQEHANRNRIIEFIDRKQKDLSLLYLAIKGSCMQTPLVRKLYKKKRCEFYSAQLVDVAEFLAGMYESMKTSFVPRHDLRLALQAVLDPRKLLISREETKQDASSTTGKENSQGIYGLDFSIITRLMKIYLLKETINNYTIEDGMLILHSKWFNFYLILWGEYFKPDWRILQVTGPGVTAAIEKQLISRLYPTPRDIQNFCLFYEHRRQAMEVFEALEEVTQGFFKNFSGRIGDYYISGALKNSNFHCSVNIRKEEHVFINKSLDVLKEVMNEGPKQKEEEEIADAPQGVWNFWQDELGENYTLFVDELFLSFNEARSEYVIGKYPNGRATNRMSIGLDIRDGRLIGVPKEHGFFNEDRAKQLLFRKDFVRFVDAFVQRNSAMMQILYRALLTISDFNLRPYFILDEMLTIADMIVLPDLTVKYSGTAYSGDALSDSFLLFSDALIQLYCLSQNIPEGFEVVENLPGKHILLSIYGIMVNISSTVETSVGVLTNDISQFRPGEAMEYIKNFGILYKHRIFPMAISFDTVLLDLHAITGGFLLFKASAGGYYMCNPKICEILKLPAKILFEDESAIIVLYRAHLVAKFHILEQTLNGKRMNCGKMLRFDDGGTAMLTQEGIVYRSDNLSLDEELTRTINEERDMDIKVRQVLRRYRGG